MLVVFGSLTVISAQERKSKFADVLISHSPSPQIPVALAKRRGGALVVGQFELSD